MNKTIKTKELIFELNNSKDFDYKQSIQFEIFNMNKEMVYKIYHRHFNNFSDWKEDLISQGLLYLWEIIPKTDLKIANNYSVYWWKTIYGKLQVYFNNNHDIIRNPISLIHKTKNDCQKHFIPLNNNVDKIDLSVDLDKNVLIKNIKEYLSQNYSAEERNVFQSYVDNENKKDYCSEHNITNYEYNKIVNKILTQLKKEYIL